MSPYLRFAGLLLLVAVSGCGRAPSRACTGGNAQGPLVTGAQVLRLDLYDATVHCTDGLLAPGAPLPIASQNFTAGQPIRLPVAPGRHTMVLTTFADAAATIPLGRGCTEAAIPAGGRMCFDLTLLASPEMGIPSSDGSAADASIPDGSAADAAVPDGAAPDASMTDGGAPNDGGQRCTTSPDSCPAHQYCNGTQCVPGCKVDADCTGAGGLGVCDLATHTCQDCLKDADCGGGAGMACCNRRCSNTSTDPANCGGCGMACSTNHVTPACGGSLCGGVCAAGWGDCDQDKRTNGCETPTNTVSNCGACQISCTTSNNSNNSARSCDGTICAYVCAAGKVDCNGGVAPNSDGCECAGNGCCAGSCQTEHTNGLGNPFYDCSPLWTVGTYTQAAAMSACQAANDGSCGTASCSSGKVTVVCSSSHCWGYEGGDSLGEGWVTSSKICPADHKYAQWH